MPDLTNIVMPDLIRHLILLLDGLNHRLRRLNRGGIHNGSDGGAVETPGQARGDGYFVMPD